MVIFCCADVRVLPVPVVVGSGTGFYLSVAKSDPIQNGPDPQHHCNDVPNLRCLARLQLCADDHPWVGQLPAAAIQGRAAGNGTPTRARWGCPGRREAAPPPRPLEGFPQPVRPQFSHFRGLYIGPTSQPPENNIFPLPTKPVKIYFSNTLLSFIFAHCAFTVFDLLTTISLLSFFALFLNIFLCFLFPLFISPPPNDIYWYFIPSPGGGGGGSISMYTPASLHVMFAPPSQVPHYFSFWINGKHLFLCDGFIKLSFAGYLLSSPLNPFYPSLAACQGFRIYLDSKAIGPPPHPSSKWHFNVIRRNSQFPSKFQSIPFALISL